MVQTIILSSCAIHRLGRFTGAGKGITPDRVSAALKMLPGGIPGVFLLPFPALRSDKQRAIADGVLLRRFQLITSAKNQVVLCRQHGLLRAVGSLAAR